MYSLSQAIERHELLGADFYHAGRPLSHCSSRAMERGWREAQAQTENAFAESSGLGGWYVALIETTVEAAIAAQMDRNRIIIEANVRILAGGR